MNKLQWEFNKNTQLFIHEYAYENIVCEMAAILSRGDELNNVLSRAVFQLWFLINHNPENRF